MPDRPGAIRPVRAEIARIKGLIYGDPGSGKSVLVGSAAPEKKTLFLKSRSDNIESVAIQGHSVDAWEMEDWNDMEEAHHALRYDDLGYDIVNFDTITLFQELGLEDIMVDLIENQNKTHRKVWLPDKGEYGQNMNRLSKWVRDMVGLEAFDFFMVAHAFMWQQPGEEEERRWPLIQGKGMPAKIAGYCNLVGYMTAGTNDDGVYTRKLHVRKEDDYYGKDGWDAFPAGFINDPTLPKIFKAIERRRAASPLPAAAAKKAPAAKKTAAVKAAAPAKKAGVVTKKAGSATKAVASKATTARKGNN